MQPARNACSKPIPQSPMRSGARPSPGRRSLSRQRHRAPAAAGACPLVAKRSGFNTTRDSDVLVVVRLAPSGLRSLNAVRYITKCAIVYQTMIQPEPPFPTEGIVPEYRQIGRRNAILGLERRLREPHHRAIIDERRVGKSSVAYAALQRLDEDPSIMTSLSTCARSAPTRRPTWSGLARRGARRRHRSRRIAQTYDGVLRSALAGKGEALVADISRLVSRAAGAGEIADAAGVATSLAGVLSGDELPDIAAQLQALEAWGLVDDQTIIIFIDEVRGARRLARRGDRRRSGPRDAFAAATGPVALRWQREARNARPVLRRAAASRSCLGL